LLAVKSSPKAAGAAGSVLFTVCLPWMLPPRNTCVRDKCRLQACTGRGCGNYQARWCVFLKRLIVYPQCFLRPLPARLINYFMASGHFAESKLSAWNSERWFKAGAVATLQIVAPLSKFSGEYWNTAPLFFYLTRRSNPFTSFTGRHYVPPF